MEAQEKILAFSNRFHEFGTQTVEGAECVTAPFPVISEGENTLILNLTGIQIRELLSSIQVGSEWAYPDKSHQILFNFMKGLVCPPEMEESGDCVNYLPYAPFLTYTPQNPYNEPNTIPPDYISPAFVLNSDLEYPLAFGYLETDVFVPFTAINIAPENVVTLNYPTIKISVRGTGQIELDLLAVQAGGFAILKVGSPPNILDIIQEGIIEAGIKIIDLENDSVTLPPESDIVVAEEINIEAAAGVLTEVYIVFAPKLNDSLNALGFGGGIRQIGLCGFEIGASEMFVEDVRFNELTCEFEKRISGVWSSFDGNWLECVPEPSGGGGGGGGILPTVYEIKPAATNIGANSFTTFTGFTQSHTFTKQNAIIIVKNLRASKPTGAGGLMRLAIDGVAGDNAIELEIQNAAARNIALSEVFSGLSGSQTIQIQGMNSSGTVDLASLHSVIITIIEFDDAASVGVEDIRIFEGELQKKIGGIWIDVSTSLEAIISSLQSQVSAAAAAAAAAQSTANTALSNANSAISVNTVQNSRLSILEAFKDDAELELAQNALDHASFDSRLDALESASGEASPYLDFGVWSHEFDFGLGDFGWTMIAGYTRGSVGWTSTLGSLPTDLILESPIFRLNNVTHIGIEILRSGHPDALNVEMDINNGDVFGYTESVPYTNPTPVFWVRMDNLDDNNFQLRMTSSVNRFGVKSIKLLGRGLNPFI